MPAVYLAEWRRAENRTTCAPVAALTLGNGAGTTRSWADGSSAGYGPEVGTGPNQLAYLRIAGQGCLYNVWSRLGVEHLELLLEQLRLVEVPARTGS